MTDQPQKGDLIFYQTSEGKLRIEVLYEAETFWLSQKGIAELFGVDVRTVNEHLQNIFVSGELARPATIRNFRIVQTEGSRQVRREVEFYNLDAIISVGYRVSSAKATEFRIWATQTLREFITKGFVLDDERLKLNRRFGKDYFDELLERIREIRARICDILPLEKDADVAAALQAVKTEFPAVRDFERDFPSLCFALATGVGKTRLMGAFIAFPNLRTSALKKALALNWCSVTPKH